MFVWKDGLCLDWVLPPAMHHETTASQVSERAGPSMSWLLVLIHKRLDTSHQSRSPQNNCRNKTEKKKVGKRRALYSRCMSFDHPLVTKCEGHWSPNGALVQDSPLSARVHVPVANRSDFARKSGRLDK